MGQVGWSLIVFRGVGYGLVKGEGLDVWVRSVGQCLGLEGWDMII